MLSVVFYRNSKYDLPVFVVDEGEGGGKREFNSSETFPRLAVSPWHL